MTTRKRSQILARWQRSRLSPDHTTSSSPSARRARAAAHRSVRSGVARRRAISAS